MRGERENTSDEGKFFKDLVTGIVHRLGQRNPHNGREHAIPQEAIADQLMGNGPEEEISATEPLHEEGGGNGR